MNGKFINERHIDTGYKIRCMGSLMTQIKKDYVELNQLWQKFDNNQIGEIEINELLQKISWVKQGLKMIGEYRNKGVEGVLWVDEEQIMKELRVKENQIIKNIRFVSDETEYSHLR